MVSHDLRRPLNTISMGAGLIRRCLSKEVVDKDLLLKNVSIIEQSAANMDRMISDLLDIERMTNNKFILNLDKINLCSLLQKCQELFSPIFLSKSFTLTIQACPEPIIANVDQDRIFQVLSNLISNAIKFTPHAGVIKLSVCKKDCEVEISVADNGPGIPENKKALIFDRFSQLKTDDRRGLGLGLFICKWIVEEHSGRIWADSEVGKGSIFTFALPINSSK